MPVAKVYTWTVIGDFAFPVDMLRYDACYPTTSEDVAEISASLESAERVLRRKEKKPFKITVRSRVGGPSEARWNSMGWKVTDKREERA